MKLHADIDRIGLPVLGVEHIDGRALRYSWPIGQVRLRIVFLDRSPAALGSVVALDTDAPCLTVCEPLHLEWGLANAEPTIAGAIRLWREAFGDRDG